MYCRRCHHDLRHLPEPRCPECGTPFDPADPRSSLRDPPRPLEQLILRSARLILTLLLLGYFTAYLFVPPLRPRFAALGAPEYRGANLKALVTAWAFERRSPNAGVVFDVQALRQYVRPSLSAWSEYSSLVARRKWHNLATACRTPAVIIGVYCAHKIIPSRRRARRVFAACTAMALLCLLGAWQRQQVAAAMWPDSYRYLSDYAFRTEMDFFALPDWPGAVFAFEKRPWQGITRAVAFGDGHVEIMPERSFLQLAAKQGLALDPTEDAERVGASSSPTRRD